MHVVATAGHVDHGKSRLVQALTGSDPDRLDEEHRRGLSIELGYCWTDLPGVGEVAFVDVPGHERFVPTMLSGVGPVPAVLLVVAADDPWMPQAAEHLAALNAFGVRHGVVAVTRSDLADPAAAQERARHELARTTLAAAPVVPVSAQTGDGVDDLREALVAMLQALPKPDSSADVRLWVDRRFVVQGVGTVVTGTLPAGTVRVGDTLMAHGSRVRVRGVQTLGHDVEQTSGVARVALRLGGTVPDALDRGSVLVSPGAWRDTPVVDVRLAGDARPPERPLLHVGAAAVACHLRPLDEDHARLALGRPLPLRVGDTALLRDPGSARIWGVDVLDPVPPSLRRRGAARRRAERLIRIDRYPDLADELDRRGWVEADLLRRIGVPLTEAETQAVAHGGWLLDRRQVPSLRRRVTEIVRAHRRTHPLEPGPTTGAVVQELALPTAELLPALLDASLRVREGRVVAADAGSDPALPADLEQSLRRLADDLRTRPFAAPDAARLTALGLHHRAIAAAERAGRLLRVADGVVLMRGADALAASWLSELPQPFTASEARVRLDTTRRVALPLLELLDRRGFTERLPDDRRRVNRQTVHGGATQG